MSASVRACGQWAVLLLALVASSALAQGRFVAAGSLATARSGHSATRLKDGRVLVVGGRSVDGLRALASVELYEPRARTWSAVASLRTARANHTATLLADGRVLVAGGISLVGEGEAARFAALSSAEVYEPKQNQWVPVGAMAEPRNGHSATVLVDGAVLVVGGSREARTFLRSVERFEPGAGVFTAGPPLAGPRALHAAVRLDDGSVVVVGGRDAKGTLEAAERFEGGAWGASPPMTEPRQRMGAVVLEERGVVVVGGQTGTSSTNLAETWRPGEQAWRPLENHLSLALSGHSATLLPGGDVLVVGGEPPNDVDTVRAQRWHKASHQWCLAGALRTGRKAHTATLLNDGRVLVVGGVSGGVPEKSVEVWEDAPGRCQEPPGLASGW